MDKIASKVSVSACEGQTEGERVTVAGEIQQPCKGWGGGEHITHIASCICWTSYPVT